MLALLILYIFSLSLSASLDNALPRQLNCVTDFNCVPSIVINGSLYGLPVVGWYIALVFFDVYCKSKVFYSLLKSVCDLL